MEIIVQSVGEVVSKQGQSKPYTVFELQYVVDGTKKKTQVMSFSKAYKPLLNAAEGEIFDIVVSQNGKYTNWDSATSKGMAPPEAQKAAVAAPAARGKGDYETAEERARKQVYIVRQSSITNAIALGVKTKEAAVETAKFFEAYVFDNQQQSVATAEPVDKLVD